MRWKQFIQSSILSLLLCIAFNSCLEKKSNEKTINNDFETILTSGELRVLTLSGSTSYFIYKGEERGYEYEMIKRFADNHGLRVKVIVADNIGHMMQMLLDSIGDVIAYEIPITGDTKDMMLHCGPERISAQVIVQQDKNPISDVTELIGQDVYVERNSKYEERIKNLNQELGGGINIHCIDKDTIVTEDLIEMVSRGEIPYTLADENVARLNRTFYHNIDIYLPISFPQRSRWAVRNNSPMLAQAINEWITSEKDSNALQAISKRYFESNKQYTAASIQSLIDGRISEYDDIFKREAAKIGWDWRMLASIAYHESRFDTTVVSWAGARGIMQLMPATAAAFGVGMDSIAYPEPNVRAAVKSIQAVERSIKSVEDPEEKIMFVLAAYNSGLGHVFDAIALAKKHGKNPQKWYGEVEEAMLMKSNPAYYNDDVCRFGYFRGRQTTSYVRQVMTLYHYYCEKIPE